MTVRPVVGDVPLAGEVGVGVPVLVESQRRREELRTGLAGPDSGLDRGVEVPRGVPPIDQNERSRALRGSSSADTNGHGGGQDRHRRDANGVAERTGRLRTANGPCVSRISWIDSPDVAKLPAGRRNGDTRRPPRHGDLRVFHSCPCHVEPPAPDGAATDHREPTIHVIRSRGGPPRSGGTSGASQSRIRMSAGAPTPVVRKPSVVRSGGPSVLGETHSRERPEPMTSGDAARPA